MIKNLVLSGGAFKSFAFLGCIKLLEERKLFKKLDTIVGTSAGAILGYCLALGYTASEIYDVVLQEFTDKGGGDDIIALESFFALGEHYGVDDGTRLILIFKRFMYRKLQIEDCTFLEFAKRTGTNLIITGTNISKHVAEYFSVDSTPTMSVITALRITTCIPLVFRPVEYQDCLYIDGGLFDNFPVSLLAHSDVFHTVHTLGLFIDTKPPVIRSFWDYLSTIINGVLDRQYVAQKKILDLPNVCKILIEEDQSMTWKVLQLKIDKSLLDTYIVLGKGAMETFLGHSPLN